MSCRSRFSCVIVPRVGRAAADDVLAETYRAALSKVSDFEWRGVGLLHWLGWFIAPHLLVAILATTTYWNTNPVLCIIAWFFAFAGTGGESRAAHWGSRRRRRRYASGAEDAG